ncbi:unnamed protein product [Amoebophrya sp. A120]|nr:unnamed protein product [Amoebophrya sp. A120]|eukprot:GSA120T00011139001.1
MNEKDYDATQQKKVLLDAGYPEPQVKLMMVMLTDPASGSTYEERAKNAAAHKRGLFADFVALDQDKSGELTANECPALAARTGGGGQKVDITAAATFIWAPKRGRGAASLEIFTTGQTTVETQEADLAGKLTGQASLLEVPLDLFNRKVTGQWATRPGAISSLWNFCSMDGGDALFTQLETRHGEAVDHLFDLAHVVNGLNRLVDETQKKYSNEVADKFAVRTMTQIATQLKSAMDTLLAAEKNLKLLAQ